MTRVGGRADGGADLLFRCDAAGPRRRPGDPRPAGPRRPRAGRRPGRGPGPGRHPV